MSRSFSPPIRRSGADAALEAIDAALAADEVLCFCGCGRLVDGTRPSLYFYGMSCSDFWHRSQHYPDPEAWRAQMRAHGPTEDDLVRRAELHDMARPDLIPTDTVPSALDRLESRPSPLRDRVYPPPVPRTVTAPTALERLRGVVERVLPARPRRRVVTPEAQTPPLSREFVAEAFRAAVENGTLMAQLQEAQAEDLRVRSELVANSWSITYIGDWMMDGRPTSSSWRVDCGGLSEIVHVGPDQSHQQVVMACVERLRAQQNGRLE